MDRNPDRLLRHILLCWIVAGLASLTAVGASRGVNEHRASIDFVLFHDYLIVVKGEAGPLSGLNFLLDTGATPSVLDPAVAQRLHLATSPVEIAVLQGIAEGGQATLSHISVGPFSNSNLPVLVEDLSFVQKQLPVHLDGIVGLDVLGRTPFVIDYSSRKIEFGEADLGAPVPLELDGGLAMLNVTLDDRPTRLLLDTGAPSLILFRKATASGSGNQRVSTGSIGEHPESGFRQSSLRLGTQVIEQANLTTVSSQAGPGHEFAGVLSPAGLGFRRVSIDVLHGQVSFSRNP